MDLGTIFGLVTGKTPLKFNIKGHLVDFSPLLPKLLVGGVKIADIKKLDGAAPFHAELDALDKLYGDGLGLADAIPLAGDIGALFSHPDGGVVAVPAPWLGFSPIPGRVTIIDSTKAETHAHVTSPYPPNTHFHLDLANLLNDPSTWPEGEPNGKGISPWDAEIVCYFDGVESDGKYFAAGSIDKDGYAGRANLYNLPDDKPHTGGVQLRVLVDGVHRAGPILKLDFQQAAATGDDAPAVYKPGFWRVEKDASGTLNWVFHNGAHKELYRPGMPGYGCGVARPQQPPTPEGAISVCSP